MAVGQLEGAGGAVKAVLPVVAADTLAQFTFGVVAAVVAWGRQSHFAVGRCGQDDKGRPGRRTGIMGRLPAWLQLPARCPRMHDQLHMRRKVRREVP